MAAAVQPGVWLCGVWLRRFSLACGCGVCARLLAVWLRRFNGAWLCRNLAGGCLALQGQLAKDAMACIEADKQPASLPFKQSSIILPPW